MEDFCLDLFEEATNKVLAELKPLEHDLNINCDDVLTIIREVYNYSINLNLKTIDSNFVKLVTLRSTKKFIKN